MKNNSNYFSHDGNASQDPKIMELLMIHKLEWYWLYWRIIEMLFNADWYKLECSKCQAIAYQLHLSFEAFDKIFKFMVNIWLLKEKDWQFWSDSLLKRMELKEEIRKKRIEAWRQWWINKSKQNVANAKQIASNKIKLNKIKLKEINNNILSKDNINIDKSISEQSSGLFDEPVEEFWKPDINLLIKELKDFCNKNWISYDKEDERKFWKHIMTAKEYWEFCESIKQDRIQFALNVLKASIKINYWKWVCSWPKKIYQNYSEVYNQTKLKNYKNTNYILPWID